MMKRFLVATVVVGLIGIVPAIGTQAASTPKISFTLKAAPTNSSLIFVGTRTAKKVPAGAKSVNLPSTFKTADGYRFSVHFISSTGRYLGPVVFGTKAPVGKWTTFVVTKSSMKLGSIAYQAEGWAKASTKLGAGQYGKLLRGATKKGQPRGAGRLGVLAKLSASDVSAFAANPCPSEVDQELGTDCDGDGIINVIDVDDDGDAVLDVADKSTEDFTASGWIPTAGTRSEVGNSGGSKVINSNISPATVDADIDQMLGSADSGFGISFFLNLATEDATKLDAAWVDCGAIEYCGRETGTASTGPTSSLNNKPFAALFCEGFTNSAGSCSKTILWKDFPGYIYDSSGYSKVVDKGEGIYNGMQFSSIDGNGYTWVGYMRPTLGANALTKMKTGDPYIVKVRDKATGTIREIPMALGAFFLTTPAVTALGDTAIDYTKPTPLGSYSNPYVVGDDGIVKVTFYRPQRAAIEGTDPAGQKYMDIGGLDYGFTLEADPNDRGISVITRDMNQRLFGCGNQGAYTLPQGFVEDTSKDDRGAVLWNVRDQSTDAVPSVDRSVTVTLNLKTCIANQKSKLTVDWARARGIMKINLIGAGTESTGGRNAGLTSFSVSLPKSADDWTK
jgi:hypothetical protein